jgi:hypothetical protein
LKGVTTHSTPEYYTHAPSTENTEHPVHTTSPSTETTNDIVGTQLTAVDVDVQSLPEVDIEVSTSSEERQFDERDIGVYTTTIGNTITSTRPSPVDYNTIGTFCVYVFLPTPSWLIHARHR